MSFKKEYKNEFFLWFFIFGVSVAIISVFGHLLLDSTYEAHVRLLKERASDTLNHLQFVNSELSNFDRQKYIEGIASESNTYSYVLIMDMNAVATAHCNPARVGMSFLEDGFRKVLETHKNVEQIHTRDADAPDSPYHGEKTLDMLSPLYSKDGKLEGVVNIGLSLKLIHSLRTDYLLILLLGMFIWCSLLLVFATMRFRQLRMFYRIQSEKRENEERFLRLIQNSNDIFTIIDEKGFQKFIGGPCEKITGYKPEELIGRIGFENIHHDDLEKLNKALVDVVANPGILHKVEYRYRHKNGTWIPLEVFGVNLLHESGINGIVLNIRDVTERKQAEAALQASEAALREKERTLVNMLSTLPGVVYQFYARPDGTTGMYFVSEKSWDMLGIDPNDPEYVQNITASIVPEDRQNFIDSITHVIENFSEWRYEGRRIKPDGSLQWMSGHSLPARVDDEIVFTGFLLDITDFKNAQNELWESQEKFSKVFNLSPDMIGITRVSDGKILDGNLAFTSLTGYTREEFLGKTVVELGLYADPDTRNRVIETVSQHGELKDFELDMRLKSGEVRHCLMSIKPIFIETEECFSFVVHDITERILAERIIRNLNESLEKKLVALTRPVGDISNLDISELFDVNELQRIQDSFAEATGVASIITMPDGTPITKPSNFCHLCENIIRKTERGLKNCYHSDAILGKPDSSNGYKMQHCLSGGLWDAGTSIFAGEKHIANWLIGQVLEEPVDEDAMLRYAHQIGADENEFRNALRQVTRMPKEQFEKISQFLYRMADQLSRLALQNVQQARFITERRQAEEALRENEEIFNQLMEQSPIYVFFKDENIRSLKLSRNFEEMLGRPINELIGKSMNDLFPSEMAAKMLEDDKRILQEGKASVIEETLNGRIYSTRKFPIYCDGKATRMAGFTIDITEQKLAESKLRESEERFRIFIDNSYDALFIHDLDGGMIDVNQTMLKLYGVTYEEALKYTIADYTGPESNTEDVKRIWKLVAQGEKKLFPWHARRPKDGSCFDVEVFLTRVFVAGKALILANVRDITERKQFQKKLAESELLFRKSIETLPLGCVISDMNENILYINRTFTELFGYTMEDMPTAKEWMDKAYPMPEYRNEVFSQWRNDIKKLATSGRHESHSFIFDVTTKEGRNRTVEFHQALLGDKVLILSNDITVKMMAEDALRKSEELFRNTFENHSAVMLLIDPENGNIIKANQAASDFYGWPKDVLMKMNIMDINTLSPAEIQRELENVHRQKRVQFEFRHRRADASIRDVSVFSSKISSEGRDFLHSIIHDITERKEAEKELLAKTEELNRYFTSSLDMLCIADMSGRFVRLNPEWERVLGYPIRELEGRPFLDLIHPEDLARTRSAMSQLDDQQSVLSFENRYRCKDGSYRWIEWRSHPENNLIYAVARDITERKQAEEDLRKAQELYRGVVDTQSEMIARFTYDGTFTFVNRAWQEYYSRYLNINDDVIGKKVSDYMQSESFKLVQLMLDEVAPGDFVSGSERSFVDKNGETRWQHWHIQKISANPNGQREFQVVGTDITERKKAEVALKESEARFHRMAQNIHDGLSIVENGKLVFVNDRACEIFGYSREEMLHLRGADLAIGEYKEILEQLLSDHRSGKRDQWEIDFKVKRKDGEIRHVHSRYSASESGGVRSFYIMTSDITERMLALEALRKSEETFRAFTENSTDTIMRFYREARHLYVNPAVERHSGIPRERFLGKKHCELGFPEDLCQLWDLYIHEVFDTGKVGRKEFRLPNGLWIDWILMPEFGADGSVSAVITSARDITEIKHTEKALRDSEERWQFALEGAGDGVWDWNTETNKIFFSHQWKAMLGFSDEEIGDDYTEWDRLVHPDDKAAAVVDIEKHFRGETPIYQSEYRMRCKDGSYKWILDRGKVVEWKSQGKPIRMIGTHSDITEIKNKENLLRIERDFNQTLIHDSPLFFVAIKSNGETMMMNKTMLDALGYEADEVLGKDYLNTVIPEDDREDLKMVFSKIIEFGIGTESINNIMCKDGRKIPVEWHGKPIFLSKEFDFFIGIGFDITERIRAAEEQKQLQMQLQQSLKMESVGRLAGGMAHDFNNLLTSISGNVELALSEIPKENGLFVPLGEVRKASLSAASLIKQLLAFSRKQIIEPRVVDLNALISNMHRMLARLIGEDIHLQSMPQENIKAVKIDPSQFEQILVNLAVNARDAMPEGGVLSIETAQVELDEEYSRTHTGVSPGTYIMLAVSDTGRGMSAEIKEHIFEPFFTTKPKGEGTGLGLATTYGAVKQAGGLIEVYSELDEGTTFKIYLPAVSEKAETAESDRVSEELLKGSETVLLVEDEQMVRNLAIRLLGRMGYRVIEASNGHEALKIAGDMTERIDLLMTDVVMPGMNGRQLADKLKEIHPETKVLFTSGYTENIIAHHGVVDEGLNFIGKPYSMNMLARKIRETLEASEASN